MSKRIERLGEIIKESNMERNELREEIAKLKSEDDKDRRKIRKIF